MVPLKLLNTVCSHLYYMQYTFLFFFKELHLFLCPMHALATRRKDLSLLLLATMCLGNLYLFLITRFSLVCLASFFEEWNDTFLFIVRYKHSSWFSSRLNPHAEPTKPSFCSLFSLSPCNTTHNTEKEMRTEM